MKVQSISQVAPPQFAPPAAGGSPARAPFADIRARHPDADALLRTDQNLMFTPRAATTLGVSVSAPLFARAPEDAVAELRSTMAPILAHANAPAASIVGFVIDGVSVGPKLEHWSESDVLTRVNTVADLAGLVSRASGFVPIPHASAIAAVSTIVRIGGDVYELLSDEGDAEDALRLGSNVLELASSTVPQLQQGPAHQAVVFAKESLGAAS